MKYTTIILIALCLTLGRYSSQAQNIFAAPVSVNNDASAPHPSAILDLSSSGRGLTIPIVDSLSEITNMIPVEDLEKGMLFYAKDTKSIYAYNGNNWMVNGFHDGINLPSASDTADQYLLYVDDSNGARRESVNDLSEDGGIIHRSDMFMATSAESRQLPFANNSSYAVPFQNEHFDTGSSFSGTGFRARNEGYYFFSSDISFTGGTGVDDTLFLQFDINGQPSLIRTLIDPLFFTRSGRERSSSISGILYLERNDNVTVAIYDIDRTGDVSINRRTFSGFFLSY